MAGKFRVMYADGTPLASYDHWSQVRTCLDHSVAGKQVEVKNALDAHNFTLVDKTNGKPILIVSGPAPTEAEAADDTLPAGSGDSSFDVGGEA